MQLIVLCQAFQHFFLHKQKQRVDTLLIYTEEPYELAQPGTLNALYILSLVRLASDC